MIYLKREAYAYKNIIPVYLPKLQSPVDLKGALGQLQGALQLK